MLVCVKYNFQMVGGFFFLNLLYYKYKFSLILKKKKKKGSNLNFSPYSQIFLWLISIWISTYTIIAHKLTSFRFYSEEVFEYLLAVPWNSYLKIKKCLIIGFCCLCYNFMKPDTRIFIWRLTVSVISAGVWSID